MSDTAPKNQNALLHGHVATAARSPRQPDVVAWAVTKDGRTLRCELFNDERVGAGWEVRLVQPEEFLSRRCRDEGHARFLAAALKQDHLGAGWTET
jgi:hypothetical protein